MVHFIIILLLRKGVKVFFGLCAYFFISFLVIKEKSLFCGSLAKISMTIQPSRDFQFLPYHAKNIPRIREFLFRIYLH